MLLYNTPTKQVGSAYKCWAVDEQSNAGRQGVYLGQQPAVHLPVTWLSLGHTSGILKSS